jgi:hypothetical protein
MVRGALVVAFAVALLAGCGGSGFPHPSFSLPCAPQPEGALCINVTSDHLSVKEVMAYLSASGVPLTGKTWRFLLTVGGRSYAGPSRHGNPPLQVFCKDASGNTVTIGNGCHVLLGSARTESGGFGAFNPPVSVTSGTQICVAEQVKTAGTWQTMTTPARACSTVS